MVGVLIEMKLTLIRRAMTGGQRGRYITGIGLGLIVSVGTLLLGVNDQLPDRVTEDLIAATWLLWALGWLLGPIFAGGGESNLRVESFSRVPLSSTRLARSLMGASLVGVGPLITLIAGGAMIAYGIRHGLGPAAVAIIGTVAEIALLVLASHVVVGLLGEVMRSRLGAALVAIPWAVSIGFVCNIGIILFALGQTDLLTAGFNSQVSTMLRIAPTGWSMAAIIATQHGDWLGTFLPLAGLAIMIVVLLTAWSLLLRRRMTGALIGASNTAARDPRVIRILPTGPLGAVIGKELRSWSRDLMRTYFWYFAIAFGLALCIIPLVAGVTAYLPWTGITVTMIAAAGAANVYAVDGTALWLILMRPGSEGADIRGRQIAWLIRVVPVAVLLTVIGTAASGLTWTWPWVIGLQLVALGAGAGLMVALAAAAPRRMPDAHRRSTNPSVDSGNIAGQIWTMIGLVLACAFPTAATLAVGAYYQSSAIQGLGVLLGAGSGILYAWLFGRVARRRLQTHGPELLLELRTGQKTAPPIGTSGLSTQHERNSDAARNHREEQPSQELAAPPQNRRWRLVIGLCLGAGWIPLLSAALTLARIDAPMSKNAWTFALSFPDPLRIPMVTVLFCVGVLLFATGAFGVTRLLRRRSSHKSRSKAARP